MPLARNDHLRSQLVALGPAGAFLLAALLWAACPGPGKQGGGPGTAGPPPSAVERPGGDPGLRPGQGDTPRPGALTASRTLTGEEQVAIGAGGHVTAPAGWHLARSEAPAYVVLTEPDRELRLTLVTLEAKNASGAIMAAWKRTRPDFSLAERDRKSPPARDGWDVITQVVYQTPSTQQVVVLAVAWGKGQRFVVALVTASQAALGRRGAQMQGVLTSLKVPGVSRESLAGKTAHSLGGDRLAQLEAFIKKSMTDLDVTGAAVAIVQGGKVIYEKGFGVRRRGAETPVTPKTLFMIGSITKSLTSLMMARLVDQKRFTWDTLVTSLWKGFALGDPEATAKCQVRHTLCACTGLPRQDMEFLFDYRGATAESRMKLLSTMRPTTGFGETFQYSNLLVSAGGYVAAHAAYPRLKLGPAYLRAMNEHLFKPLAMTASTFDSRRAARLDHAVPHSPTLELKYQPIPLGWEDTVISVGPAGGAWSNVQDMARYLLVELGRGKTPAGRQVVSAENLEERWKPGVSMATDQHYGLALVENRSKGIRILGHGGGTLGFSTNMVFFPDHDVGVVTLTNNGGGSGGWNSLVLQRLMELLFDAEPRAQTALAYTVKKLVEDLAKGLKEMELEPPASFFEPHVGTYQSEDLGKVVIRVKAGMGELDAGEWQAPLHKHRAKDGVVRLVLGRPLAGLALEPGTKDGRRTLTLRTAQKSYSFVDTEKPRAEPARP